MEQDGCKQQGFTYLAVLFFTALMGAAWAAAGMMWSTAQQREKEQDLLFIGNEFRKAIALYYERTPGSIKRYPQRLEELLQDNRQLAMTRYLRQVYTDPMTLKKEWGIVRAQDGGIMGVHSLSAQTPMKRSGFAHNIHSTHSQHSKYSDWQFIYRPE